MKKKTVEQKYVSREKFVIEMNAKNTAYAFILQNGLLFQFKAFCEKMRAEEQDAQPLGAKWYVNSSRTPNSSRHPKRAHRLKHQPRVTNPKSNNI